MSFVIGYALSSPMSSLVVRPVRTAPVSLLILTHSGYIIKAKILGFILVAVSCITRTNHKRRPFNLVICLTIIFMCCCPVRNMIRIDCLLPDMISPVIITARKTNHYIIAVFIICCTKDIPVHNSDQTLDRARSLICCCGLQMSSDHHNKAYRLTTSYTLKISIFRPISADIFAIISLQHKIVISIVIICLRL